MSIQETKQGIRGQQRVKQVSHVNSRRTAERLISKKVILDIYMMIEALIICFLGLAVAELYVGEILENKNYLDNYLLPTLILPLFAAFVLHRNGTYDFMVLSRFPKAIGQVIIGLTTAYVAVILLGFAAGIANDYSRVWFVSWYALTISGICILRMMAMPLFAHSSASRPLQKVVAIYGYGEPLEELAEELQRLQSGVQVIGGFGPSQYNGRTSYVPYGGTLEDLIAFSQQNPIDAVIVAVPLSSRKRLKKLLVALSVLPVEVQLYPAFSDQFVSIRGISALDSLQLLDIQRKPISDWGVLVKSVEDYVIGALAAVLFAPLLLIIAAAIKLDSHGPVFFRQRRHGFNNNEIVVWKFRTMHVMEDGDDFVQAIPGDTRVTRVGAFLRRTSLDELPQLFNVLKGDMSIVGPRPHALAMNSHYARVMAQYENRHRVKPGITGWAQINGFRGLINTPYDMRRRLELDLEYIEHWNLWFDLKILTATLFIGFLHRNAL